MEPVRREPFEYRVIAAAIITAVVIMIAGVGVSVWLESETRKAIARQFNAEQLSVARNIRRFVELELSLIKKELVLLTRNLRTQTVGGDRFPAAIRDSFHRVVENGVQKIEILNIEDRRRTVYIPFKMLSSVAMGPDDPEGNEFSARTEKNSVWISEPIVEGAEILLKLAAPADMNQKRYVVFHLNVGWFLRPFLKEIRSGKSGYAWIIDNKGRFLFHPYSAYIGADAFKIRAVYFKKQSFAQINRIQSDRMLEGEEGTGQYTSSWHRGLTGEIQKLIAYTPISISEKPQQYWSVAVVAPYSEIHAAISRLHVRQFWLQGLVIAMALGSAGIIIYFEVRWSKVLEKKVFNRTEALKRSEEKYRSLVESAEDFIFTIDAEKKFLSVNSYTAGFFGSTAERLISAPIGSVFPADASGKIERCVDQVFEKQRSLREELDLKSGDRNIWISINFIPLRNEEGEMVAVLSIARDITESKNLERQLISAEKLASLGTLAAGVAHELNNPLGVMLGFCDLLMQKKDRDSQEYADLKIIEQQGIYCKEIVENLLSFARVKEQIHAFADVNQCLEQVIAIVRHSLEMQSVEPTIELERELPTVRADQRQLQQVFLNLINNAAAAMKGGGRLKIQTMLDHGKHKVVVRFQDDGVGIRPEDLDRIYDPFFTTKPEGEGTGLGLFISYGILKKFGAAIECESRMQDTPDGPSGATFTIRLAVQ